MSKPASSVDFSVSGGLCRYCLCMNFNPCSPCTGCCCCEFEDDSHHAFSGFKVVNSERIVFGEEPGPGCQGFYVLCLSCILAPAFCVGCIFLACLWDTMGLPLKAMGLIFTLENGRVKCEIHDKSCCSSQDVITLNNVVDVVAVVEREIEQTGSTGPEDNRSYYTYMVAYMRFDIMYRTSDGTLCQHRTRCLTHRMYPGEGMAYLQKFTSKVKEMISRSTPMVVEPSFAVNSVPAMIPVPTMIPVLAMVQVPVMAVGQVMDRERGIQQQQVTGSGSYAMVTMQEVHHV